MNKEENQMYRVLEQKEGITITAETSIDLSFEEVKKTAIVNVLGGIDKAVKFQPFVVLPITTKERWEDGSINFCPRCGKNLAEQELERYATFDCYECKASMEVQVHTFDNEDD